jgi:replication initiation and membrane attachment protein DnaB
MKTILMLLSTVIILTTFSSCSNLNQKEQAVIGAWSQNLGVANLYFDLKSDKTFEAYAQANLVKGIIIYWKGNWKVEGDELKTDISEGPTLVTKLVNAKIGNLLEKFGIDNDKIAFRAKISETSKEELNMNMLKGLKIKWTKAEEEKMKKLRAKQSDMN